MLGHDPMTVFIDQVKTIEPNELQKESGAESPNLLSRKLAECILLDTSQLAIPSRVAASITGGIAIFFYSGDKYADIECFNTGEILGTIANGNKDPDIWTFKLTEIKSALEKIGTYLVSVSGEN